MESARKKSAMMIKRSSVKASVGIGTSVHAQVLAIMNMIVCQHRKGSGSVPCVESDLPALNSVDAVDVFHLTFKRTCQHPSSLYGSSFMQGYSGPTSLVCIQHLPRL